MTHHTFEKFVGGAALSMALIILAGQPAHAGKTPTTKPRTQQELGIDNPKQGNFLLKTATLERYMNAPLVATHVSMEIIIGGTNVT